MAESLVLLIRKDIIAFVLQDVVLHFFPVGWLQQFRVMHHKSFLEFGVVHHEKFKLFGKKIILVDVKPRLAGHFLLGVSGLCVERILI